MSRWHLKGKPFEVQVEAKKRMSGRRGYGLFMEMGLGKTMTVLDEFIGELNSDNVSLMVIVCPNSIKDNWAKEVAKSGIDTLPVVVWPKTPPKAEPAIWIINYEAMRARAEEIEEYASKVGTYLVFDESTRIKNFKADTAKKAILLARSCSVVRVLSGSPMVQNVMDLWAQLRAIGELSGVNPYAFRNKFAVMGGWMGKQVKGMKNTEELTEILNGCSFTALKRDWWRDMPDKVYMPPRMVELSPDQKRVYREMEHDFVARVKGQDNPVTVSMAISAMLKLQQVSSGFIFDEDGKTVHELVKPKDNPKVKELLEVMEDTKGKVIIFTYFRHTTEMLVNALKEYEPVYMKGGMPDAEIATVRDRFNNDDDVRVLVAQSSVGSLGHTFLGSEKSPCHTTIFFENDFSLLNRIQAEDRNHRRGQKRSVNYIDFASSKIESHVIKVLQKKLDLVEELRSYVKR